MCVDMGRLTPFIDRVDDDSGVDEPGYDAADEKHQKDVF